MSAGQWREPDAELLDRLAVTGALAAAGPAGDTAVRVRAALRMLLANGLLAAAPRAAWPRAIMLDPPTGPAPS